MCSIDVHSFCLINRKLNKRITHSNGTVNNIGKAVETVEHSIINGVSIFM